MSQFGFARTYELGTLTSKPSFIGFKVAGH